MNLFLYSGGSSLQNETLEQALVQTIGRKARITYIPAASYAGEAEHSAYAKEKRRLGIRRTLYFPVDQPFTEKQVREAFSSEALFLSGGNTFHFLANLRAAGMIERLRVYVRRGGTLIGLSAGSLLMTPSIDLAGLVPGESDENTFSVKRLTSLKLVDFEVYPHFSESEISVGCLLKYSRSKPQRVIYAFPDGAGIQVADTATIFHRGVSCFVAGRRFDIGNWESV